MGKRLEVPKVPKQNVKLIRLTSLSRAELAKINFEDLWLMKPVRPGTPGGRVSIRYCRCRSVCLV